MTLKTIMKPMIYNFYSKYYLIILGSVLILFFIWLKFIRERMPRDIPFNLSIIGFFLLIEICLIYFYIIFTLKKTHRKPNIFIETIITWICKPLEAFDDFIREVKMCKYVNNFISNYLVNNTQKIKQLFLFFVLIPRLLLLTIFFIDVFYFNKLKYIYYILAISILFIINKYYIYFLKKDKKIIFNYLTSRTQGVTTRYVYGILEEEDDDVPPTMFLPLEKFIDYYTKSIIEKKVTPNYTCSGTTVFYQEIKDKFKIPFQQKLKNEHYDFLQKDLKLNMQKILLISLFLEYYYNTINNIKAKNMMLLIYVNYLICWLYILIISLPSLNIFELLFVLNLTWFKILEPFSNTTIFL
jgi:hypothetical protein